MDAFLTTPDKKNLLTKLPPLRWDGGAAGLPEIVVESERRLQPFLGVGAALTDSSAWLLMQEMDSKTRQATLKALFDSKSGNGFAVLRVCVGASDFNHDGSYTYCDTPDPTLAAFSIEREKRSLIPLLKEIRKIQPKLILIASPWSAPAWMKTSKSLNGGWLEWAHYGTYAQYLVKYLKAMAAEGIAFDYLTPQNEPRHETNSYPSLRMEPADQARFIGEHLGPALRQASLATKILCWDHNWDGIDFPLAVLADEKARAFTTGVAFHGYGGEVSAQAKIQAAYPEKEIHFTESSGGDWAKDFGGNLRWDLTNLLLGSVRYGARSVLKWNLVLDENHGPQNGGCKDCRGIVTLDRKTGEITKNEEFYAFGHLGRFVPPGSHHLASTPLPELPAAAFIRPDGQYVLACCAEKETRFTLRHQGRVATVKVPAGAALTLIWK
jgi:glucosylceramidase